MEFWSDIRDGDMRVNQISNVEFNEAGKLLEEPWKSMIMICDSLEFQQGCTVQQPSEGKERGKEGKEGGQ